MELGIHLAYDTLIEERFPPGIHFSGVVSCRSQGLQWITTSECLSKDPAGTGGDVLDLKPAQRIA